MRKIFFLAAFISLFVLPAFSQNSSLGDTLKPLKNLTFSKLQKPFTLPTDSLTILTDSSAICQNLRLPGWSERNARGGPRQFIVPGQEYPYDNMPVATSGDYFPMPIMVPAPTINYKLQIKHIQGGKQPLR